MGATMIPRAVDGDGLGFASELTGTHSSPGLVYGCLNCLWSSSSGLPQTEHFSGSTSKLVVVTPHHLRILHVLVNIIVEWLVLEIVLGG